MSESPIQLEDLLTELKQEGRLDSSGKFSLDLKRAGSKLEKFRLQNQYYYVLQLVQAAVAGGATQVEVDSNNQRVRVSWNGQIPDREELLELFGYLFEETERAEVRHLRHLAAGVNTAVAIGARRIWLECWNGQAGFRHSWASGGWQQEDGVGGEPGRPEVRFSLLRSAGQVVKGWSHTLQTDFLELFRRSRVTMTNEQAAVYDRCPYAPLTVKLNGSEVNSFLFGEPRFPGYDILNDSNPGETRIPWWLKLSDSRSYIEGVCHRRHHLVERHLGAERDSPGNLRPPDVIKATVLEERGNVGNGCIAMLAIEADLNPHSRLTFIEDGVTLCQESPPLGVPGVVGLISAEGLQKDLSGFRVVHNRAYEERLAWIREQLREMTEALRLARHKMPQLSYLPTRFMGL